MEKNKNYYINNPVFIKYKKNFDFFKFKTARTVKRTFVNERIIEIPFAIQAIPKNEKVKILDLGCTESVLPLHLASLGYKVVGLDFRIFPYIHANFRFIRGDILKLPFRHECFDTVTCISTLEHLGLGFYKEPVFNDGADARAINEISRVLRKEGLLILSLPFGRRKITPQQRIYDSDLLRQLLRGFSHQEKRFFANFFQGGYNQWQEIDEERASAIESLDSSTNCVCLVTAQN